MTSTFLSTAPGPFLSDGGLETTMVFEMGFDLPLFAAYPLLDTARGRAALRTYYARYLQIARTHGTGFILESPTWRCSTGWGARLGHDADEIDRLNRESIDFLRLLRDHLGRDMAVVISGNIGPKGDGYCPDEMLTAQDAMNYHMHQVHSFADAGAEVVTAITMTHSGEAAGVVLAARAMRLPCVIGFTTETDGLLPSGETLTEAINAVDNATHGGPDYYMVNCAHPDHFAHAMPTGALAGRIGGIRANASRLSHAELDNSETLDAGDPQELAQDYKALARALPNLRVYGGCCGTDHRHVDCIAAMVGKTLTTA
ncbi:methionine synthase I (plasmid) [Paracoccaceae bacterium]|nr:methionine synthase I [Paracoccaceae bacterium]